MKSILSFAGLALLFAACSGNRTAPEAPKEIFQEEVSPLYNVDLKPFYHGVASGDPLPDRVILWTRVTPEFKEDSIPVQWEISTDEKFSTILQSGSQTTSPARDYTVKVDVADLTPGTYYYYRFRALDKTSMVGRTKTTAVTGQDSVRLAIVSCSNWEFGYFNPYDRIAEREVDAVVHLGDYIYEYGVGTYGDTTIGRLHLPPHEITTLSDYRTRYSQYHTDAGLQNARQRHPFITIWDDHEVANDSYKDGAQNHQKKEGDFQQRKEAAKQAYYEWLPIRQDKKLFRSFSFGTMADLLMMDERLEGRSKPVPSVKAPEYNQEERTMLGAGQLQWFEDHLRQSKASWKIVGNQVLFSPLNIEGLYRKNMPKNLDAWDGYPAEQKRIELFLLENNIRNVLFVSGDTHAAWAIEIPNTTGKLPSQRTVAIELGTTSVSSGNGNERSPDAEVIEKELLLKKMNPHVKYLNNRDHGYLLLTLSTNKANAQWFTVKTLRQRDSNEELNKTFSVPSGNPKLE